VLFFRIHFGGYGFKSLSRIGYPEVFCGSHSLPPGKMPGQFFKVVTSEISICINTITNLKMN
jgi:hypothetical protein